MQIRKQNRQTINDATPGFTCKIEGFTDLGSAFLVAEFADGSYLPLGVVGSLNEAQEVAASCQANLGVDVAGVRYRVWARGIEGRMRVAGCFHGNEKATICTPDREHDTSDLRAMDTERLQRHVEAMQDRYNEDAKGLRLVKALGALVLDHRINEYLLLNDPMALRQLYAALGVQTALIRRALAQ